MSNPPNDPSFLPQNTGNNPATPPPYYSPSSPAAYGGYTPGMSAAEYEMALARSKSYTSQAIVALVLYFVLWLPGLIANLVWWSQANNTQRMTGHAPEGKGCLTAMLAINGIGFALICGFLVIAMATSR